MTARPLAVGIVGMDGCGKSSTFAGTCAALAGRVRVVGIGDRVLSGGPGLPVAERSDIPLSRSARAIGGFAKRLRWQRLYKNLKLIELSEQSHIGVYVGRHDPPDVIVTDGQPLVNCAAWSAAHFYRPDLVADDDLSRLIGYLAGDAVIPIGELPYYLRRGWQLVLINYLRLARLRPPHIVVLLDLDAAVAMARIRARGKPLQSHESEPLLAELGQAYRRVCALLEARRGVQVCRIRVDEVPLAAAVDIVVATVITSLNAPLDGIGHAAARPPRPECGGGDRNGA